MSETVICWFRQDLRLTDNPALCHAAQQGEIVPVYIVDDENAGPYRMGAASRWWLHHSLESLNRSLDGQLNVFAGDPQHILAKLAAHHRADVVVWNRCYQPWQIERDKALKQSLSEQVSVLSFNGSLLWEPWEIRKQDGTPYRVFTPYYRHGCLKAPPPRPPLVKPNSLNLVKSPHSVAIADLKLKPALPWGESLEPHWRIGESGALAQLQRFIESGLDDYSESRNFPARDNVSRLSAHLRFGEISPHQVWHEAASANPGQDVERFCSELAWREFSYNLLYFNPDLPTANLQPKFNAFPWREDAAALWRWQQGLTGYPMVDAGMRELWQTGYMHNRVRMIVGSFLVKNLLLDWRLGASWFWDCLVDADLANNSAGWQWIAGCGADAAPYFRIFNPVTQGQKFDPSGAYIRQFVPELRALPVPYLFNPAEAPEAVLSDAGIVLGDTYPRPLVAIKPSRERALQAYKSLGSAV